MRKSLLSVCCLLIFQLAFAGNVTKEEARLKALTFLKQTSFTTQTNRARASLQEADLKMAKMEENYFVFNVGENDGYVVVSGLDLAPAILGYSSNGTFDSEQMPENMKAWLQGYADELAYLAQHPETPIAPPRLDEHRSIRPLITSKWKQGSPYNAQCPIVGEGRSITGCVPLAIAQLLNYWKYPASTTATIPAYTTATFGISMDSIPVTEIDWPNILDVYIGNESEEQINAVATLTRLCGASIEVDYKKSSASGYSHKVPDALVNYFGFDESTTRVDRGDYNARDWNNLVYNELANKRPVLYGGQSPTGGHAFIVDGYDKDGYFHVNWGWGGDTDNYFLLSILDSNYPEGLESLTSVDGYSYSQDAILYARPKADGRHLSPIQMITRSIVPSRPAFAKADSIVFAKMAIYNQTGDENTFDVGLGIYNEDMQLVSGTLNRSATIQPRYGWKEIELGAYIQELTDGRYTICGISREKGTEVWHQNTNSDVFYLRATVSGDSIYLKAPEEDITLELEATSQAEVGRSLTVLAKLHNNGSFYREMLYLKVNNKHMGGRYFEANEESESVQGLTFTPIEAGENVIELGYYYNVQNEDGHWEQHFHPYASLTVDVAAAPSHHLSFSNGKVTNASNKLISERTAKLQFTVTNNDSIDYDDNLKIWVFKGNGTNYIGIRSPLIPIQVAAGESKTIEADITNLGNGEYLFIVVYKTEGEFTSYNDKNAQYIFSDYIVNADPEPEPEPEPLFTGDGTLENPYTTADALIVANELSVGEKSAERYYIKGTITYIKYTFDARYGTAVFNMSTTGSAISDDQLTVYACYFLENKPWVDGNMQIKVGDEVVIYGKLTKYKEKMLETAAKDAYIYSLNNETSGIRLLNGNKRQDIIYNLNGQQVNNPSKGMYVIRSANNRQPVKKVVRK